MLNAEISEVLASNARRVHAQGVLQPLAARTTRMLHKNRRSRSGSPLLVSSAGLSSHARDTAQQARRPLPDPGQRAKSKALCRLRLG